jgi:heat shock protein HslJ
MTDEQMEARLHRAGEAWRTANAPTATVDAGRVQTLIVPATRKPQRRTGLLASAALVVAALVAGGALLVANLGSDGRDTTPPLQPGQVDLRGTAWTLTTITDANGNDVPVAGDAVLGIGPDDVLKGNDGCNAIAGKVEVRASTIDVGNLAKTEMACLDDQATATAQHVDAILSGTVTWVIAGNELTLTKDGTGSLVYRTLEAPTDSPKVPSSLTNTRWQLVGVETQGSNSATSSGASNLRMTLTLRGDSFELDAWCYADAGSYAVKGDELTLTPQGATFGSAQGCGPKLVNEAIQIVDGTLHWNIENGNLRLTNGDKTAEFESRGAAPAPIPLIGTHWTAASYETSKKLPHGDYGPVPGSDVVLTLDKTGYRLNTNCLDYSGGIQLKGAKLVLAAAQVTGGRACDNKAIDDTVAVIPGTYDWVIVGHRLTLVDKGTATDITLDS